MRRRVALVRTDVSEVRIQLLVAANVSSSLNLFNLVLTRATLRHIPEDGIVHGRRRENLKSFIALTGWAL
jgi:hypothetical protein